jgi:hypothetical protein
MAIASEPFLKARLLYLGSNLIDFVGRAGLGYADSLLGAREAAGFLMVLRRRAD